MVLGIFFCSRSQPAEVDNCQQALVCYTKHGWVAPPPSLAAAMRRRNARARQRLFALDALHDLMSSMSLGPAIEDLLVYVRSALRGVRLQDQELLQEQGEEGGAVDLGRVVGVGLVTGRITARHHYRLVGDAVALLCLCVWL